jgi:transcriptional regulator with XRE-family HTH domain
MTPEVAYLERAAEARRTIPEVIRLLLAVSRKPARELAEALGLSEASLSERLNGKTKITGEQLAVAAMFFGVEEGALYRDPDSFRRQIVGVVKDHHRAGEGGSSDPATVAARRLLLNSAPAPKSIAA